MQIMMIYQFWGHRIVLWYNKGKKISMTCFTKESSRRFTMFWLVRLWLYYLLIIELKFILMWPIFKIYIWPSCPYLPMNATLCILLQYLLCNFRLRILIFCLDNQTQNIKYLFLYVTLNNSFISNIIFTSIVLFF